MPPEEREATCYLCGKANIDGIYVVVDNAKNQPTSDGIAVDSSLRPRLAEFTRIIDVPSRAFRCMTRPLHSGSLPLCNDGIECNGDVLTKRLAEGNPDRRLARMSGRI